MILLVCALVALVSMLGTYIGCLHAEVQRFKEFISAEVLKMDSSVNEHRVTEALLVIAVRERDEAREEIVRNTAAVKDMHERIKEGM